MIATQKRKYTFDEYLALERTEGIRYEFWDGDVVAMAGATKRHNLLVNALARHLYPFTRRNRCQVFSENVRQKLRTGNKYVYPGVIYTCNADDLADDLGLYVQHPCLLIEVLSESTGSDDDHKKRLHYFKLPSLQYYVLVSQQAYKVEVYERAADFWKYQFYEGLDTVIPLPLLDITLPLAAIYEDILIEEEED